MGNFNSKSRNGGNFEVLAKGHVSMRYKKRSYAGKTYHEYSGRVILPDGNTLLINVPVDANDKVFSYKGKGENEKEEFMRIHSTLIHKKGGSRRG